MSESKSSSNSNSLNSSVTSSSEELEKSEIYKAIYDTKIVLKVYNRNIENFDMQFPKASFDRIIQLYGKEINLPLSFVLFTNPFHMSETIKYSSRNINVRTSVQIDNILDFLDNYYVYPISYENMDELEKTKIAPRLKTRYLKNIAAKMGLDFSEMINYISLQMTEIDVKETTKTIISIQVYQMVFNMIHLLNVKIPEKEPYEFTFYSYRKILKMAGIELNKIIPYLDVLEVDSKKIEIAGWMFVEEKKKKTFNSSFVLKNQETGKMYLMRTQMEDNINLVDEEHKPYGIHAQCLLFGIPKGRYDIYVLYRNNDEDMLVNTLIWKDI